ncbi:hypothetical protein OAH58_00665 [bacterium]|nr:hypothetical protein [bacterium]
MAEIRVNSTGGVKLFDADDSHYAQIKAGTITSNTDVLELGSSAVVAGTKVDLNGQELILDADADTSITADTDDQIDVRIAGADDFQFTANTFTAQSGSSIIVPDGGLTFGSTAISSTAAELNILDGVTSTAAELNILDGVTSTAAELNIVDGNTSATSTTIADADRVVLNDNGTMVQAAVTDLKTYIGGGTNTPYFQASITSNQTLVNDTSTRISFDRADVDSASGFNTTYNKYTIPTGEGGYWHIGYGIAVYGSNDSQINNINIYPNKGGSDWISFNSRHQGVSYYRFDSHCPRQFHAEKSFIGAASAGDEITITAVLGHTGGGSNTLSVGEYYSVFWGYKLAGT